MTLGLCSNTCIFRSDHILTYKKIVVHSHSLHPHSYRPSFAVHSAASSMEKAQNFSFSGGLVEIAALTALIGGSTAESLTLGNRGACGLPWAALSSFGSIFIIKACISACTPAWLRETIGVRTRGSDNAVGCSMRLNRNANNRGMTGDAVGIITELDKVSDPFLALRQQC